MGELLVLKQDFIPVHGTIAAIRNKGRDQEIRGQRLKSRIALFLYHLIFVI
jgi:hypothetical protein